MDQILEIELNKNLIWSVWIFHLKDFTGPAIRINQLKKVQLSWNADARETFTGEKFYYRELKHPKIRDIPEVITNEWRGQIPTVLTL